MQDQIITSHTCFGGHTSVNRYCLLSQFKNFKNVSDDLKRTTNAHVTPFTLTFKA